MQTPSKSRLSIPAFITLCITLVLLACIGAVALTAVMRIPASTNYFSFIPASNPVYAKWTSQQVVDAFKAAGLEVGPTSPITHETVKDTHIPYTFSEGTRFLIPSMGADLGGRVFTFNTEDDLNLIKNYYVNLGRSSAAFFSHVFVKDNVLVQINGQLPDEKAKQYKQALMNMR